MVDHIRVPLDVVEESKKAGFNVLRECLAKCVNTHEVACGGSMKIVASIEDPFVIGKILSHLEGKWRLQESVNRRPGARAPPPAVC